MEFKSYSQTRPDLKEKFYPKLELRSWEDISTKDRWDIFQRLIRPVFLNYDHILVASIIEFQYRYKRLYLGKIPRSAPYNEQRLTEIMYNVWNLMDEFFFFEFFSIYLNNHVSKDYVIDHMNDLFDQFGVNMMIRNNQFVPRQSEKIVEEIYDPTFRLLDDPTYDGVNSELNKAFESFRGKDYEDVITKSINAVQAALQILVDGEVNQKKNISILLKEAKRNNLLSDYELTNSIYTDINSFLERVRKDKAGVHPTNGSASQSDALFVLNLTMVLLQNIILNNNKKIVA